MPSSSSRPVCFSEAAALAAISAGALEGGDGIGMLARHFAIDGEQALPGGFLCSHGHPLTPPLVSPEIRARCMTRPISTGRQGGKHAGGRDQSVIGNTAAGQIGDGDGQASWRAGRR